MTPDDLKALRHPKAGAPTRQYVYRDNNGDAVLVANRFERHHGGKFFIPYSVASGTWSALAVRPLYRLPELIAAVLKRVVIVTEGEKCADALADLGYTVTTAFGGANAARKTDLTPLKGRRVVIWPDHDEAGQEYAQQIASSLSRGYRTTAGIIPISEASLAMLAETTTDDTTARPPTLSIGSGWDAADAIASGWRVREINRLIELALEDGSRREADSESVELALFGDAEFWHGKDGTPYATIQRGDHLETFALESAAFKRLLAHEHFKAKGKTPSATKLDDLARQYIGQALYEGETRPVFFRIGKTEGGFALDLGGPNWSVIEITSDGWRATPMAEPRFRRSPGMAALPRPARQGANIESLRPFVNVASDADFRLIVAWLLGALRPEGPYPLLILTGEQGSAKSTTTKVLRRLVDPAELESRSFPTDERDLMIAAQNGHVLAFDNLSRIKPAMADALCRLATGGGFATRKLHSDADEVLFKATRPIILNGIPELAERPDLADRAISLHLPTISDIHREYEAEFWQRFEAARPVILAALLDAVSGAMAAMASVRLSERPRMADFAKWATAAEQALGWTQGAFLSAYTTNRKEAEDVALDCSPVASAILTMIQAQQTWQGTAADLILHLRKRYPHLTDGSDAFPRQPSAFGAELRRVAPLLRSQGLAITYTRTGKKRRRVIELDLS